MHALALGWLLLLWLPREQYGTAVVPTWYDLPQKKKKSAYDLPAHTIKVKLTVRMNAELPGTAREYRQVGRRP